MLQRETEHVPKNLPPPLSANPLWWDHFPSISITEGSNDSDALYTDLPAEVFEPKLTVGGYAIGGGCPKVELPNAK